MQQKEKNRAKTISVSTKRFVTAYSINKFHLELGKKMAILYFWEMQNLRAFMRTSAHIEILCSNTHGSIGVRKKKTKTTNNNSTAYTKCLLSNTKLAPNPYSTYRVHCSAHVHRHRNGNAAAIEKDIKFNLYTVHEIKSNEQTKKKNEVVVWTVLFFRSIVCFIFAGSNLF